MTKKHFIAIAQTVKEIKNRSDSGSYQGRDGDLSDQVLRELSSELCRTFRRENPNFDPARFLAACGF